MTSNHEEDVMTDLELAKNHDTTADALRTLTARMMAAVRAGRTTEEKAAPREVLRAIAKNPNTATKTLRWLAHHSAILPYVRENPNFTIALLEKEE